MFANCLLFTKKKFLKSFYRLKKSIFDVGNGIIDLLFRPCRQLRGETKNTNARQNMRQKNENRAHLGGEMMRNDMIIKVKIAQLVLNIITVQEIYIFLQRSQVMSHRFSSF